jgi:hypothetical protein
MWPKQQMLNYFWSVTLFLRSDTYEIFARESLWMEIKYDIFVFLAFIPLCIFPWNACRK